MELIRFPISKYHKIISQKGEFFDPIMFATPLIDARYIGGEYVFTYGKKKISGIFLGQLQEPLLKYFQNFTYAADFHHKDECYIEEGKFKFLSKKEKEQLFEEKTSDLNFYKGAEILSNPQDPPYHIILVIEKEHMCIYAFSDDEYQLESMKENKILPSSPKPFRDKILNFVKEKKKK